MIGVGLSLWNLAQRRVGGGDPLAPGAPAGLANQSANTDVTPTIRVTLNSAGGGLSNVAGDVVQMYADGLANAAATLVAGDITNGYKDVTLTELYGVGASLSATSSRSGHGSPPCAPLAIAFDYIGVVFDGQSNALGHMTQSASPPSAAEGTAMWDNNTSAWVAMPAANGARELANAVATLCAKPVRIVYGGQTATPILGLSKGTQPYTDLMARIAASGLVPHYFCWHQGEGDAGGGTSEATYHSRFSQLHADFVADIGKTKAQCPAIVSGLGPCTAAENSGYGSNVQWTEIQRALIKIEGALANAYYSHSNIDWTLTDNVHGDGASLGRSGARYGRTIAFLRGNVATRPNPKATAAARVDTTHTDITVTHAMGSDITSTPPDFTGFDINNGGAWEAASGARQSASVVRLTHSDLGTAARNVRNNYGLNPDRTKILKDTSALVNPILHTTTDLVASGAAALPVWTYVGGGVSGSGAVYTFATALGITSANTILAIGVSGSAGAISSVTVTPDAGAVKTAAVVVNGHGGTAPAASIYQTPALDDGATSVTLTVTFAATQFSGVRIFVWRESASNFNSTTGAGATARAAATTTVTAAVSAASGGTAIALGVQAYSGTAQALNTAASEAPLDALNAGERYDAVVSGMSFAAYDTANIAADNASTDVVLTSQGTQDIRVAAATWR